MKYLRIPVLLGILFSAALPSANSALATPGTNVNTEPLARSAMGSLDTGPGPVKVSDADIQVALDKATDVAVVHGTMGPGGNSGWHSHPDAVFVTITEGTITLYDADDPTCTAHVAQAGEAFIEQPGNVHIARNESSTDRVSWYATHIGVPTGAEIRTDAAQPGNCPF